MYRIPTEDEDPQQGRIRESPDSDCFSIIEHIDEQLPRQDEPGNPAGASDFNGHNLVHSAHSLLLLTAGAPELFSTRIWDGKTQN